MLVRHKGQIFGITFVMDSKQCLHIMKCLQGNIIVSQMFTKQILQSNILLFIIWALFLVICKEIVFSFALIFCSRNKMLAENLHKMVCHLAQDVVLWLIHSGSLTPLFSAELIESLWKSTIKLSHSWLGSGLIITAAGSCASCSTTLCIHLCVVWSN